MKTRDMKERLADASAQAVPRESRAWPEVLDRSRWIWSGDDPAESNVWIVARRSFLVREKSPTWLNISADLRYLAWVNGHQLSFGPPKSDFRRPTLDRYDITSWLRRGQNVLVIQVYSLGDVEDISSCMPRQGGLIGSIESAGSLIGTDASWKLCRDRAYRPWAMRRGDVQPHQEVFDARLALGEVHDAGYDDADWPAAVELTDGPLQPYMECIEWRDIPAMTSWMRFPRAVDATGLAVFESAVDPQRMEGVDSEIARARRGVDLARRVEIKGGAVLCDATGLDPTQGVYARWDFGEIWTGYPILTLQGQPGTVVDISYAEGLLDGVVDPSRGPTNYVDRIILGQGLCTHRIFWPKTLQYLQVDVRAGRARIESVEFQASTYPVEHKGHFACSDPLFSRVWDISARTVQLCMEDNYMDTPWRERGSWLGDILIHTRTNYYAFGDTALIKRFLRLHTFGVLDDGSLCSKYPARRTTHVHTWNLTYPIAVDDLYTFDGDEQLVADCWPTCRSVVQWLEQYRTDEGLYGNLPLKVTPEDNIYTFIDWSPVDTRGCNAAFNALVYQMFGACERLAGIAGDDEQAAFCRGRRAAMKEAFRAYFWDADRGVFVNGWHEGRQLDRWGCQENYLALVSDLASPPQRHRIVEALGAEDLQSIFLIDDTKHGFLWATMAIALNRYGWDPGAMVPMGTPYFAYWAMKALFEADLACEALEIIRTHWGRFVAEGASTVWEMWDRHGSLSHGWSAGPVPIFGEYVLGVRRNPGHARSCRILPQRGDLGQARGAVPTCLGNLEVQWHFNQGRWRLDVTVPEGLGVLAGLPRADAACLWCDGLAVASPHLVRAGLVDFLATPLAGGSHTLANHPSGKM